MSLSLSTSLHLDLAQIKPQEREVMWRLWSSSLFTVLDFPELGGSDVPLRSITRESVGAGSWWRLQTSAVRIRRHGSEHDALASCLILLTVIEGEADVQHAGQFARLAPGDLYWLDGRLPMDFQCTTGSLVIMNLPRGLLTERYPHCTGLPGRHIDTAGHGGARMLHQTLLNYQSLLPSLAPTQRRSALEAVIDMHGFLEDVVTARATPHWRVARLERDIAAHLDDTTLDAETLASLQHVSRRHLDALVIRETGRSITARLWEMRLHAAQVLLEGDHAGARSITRIALDTGFQSSAHFSRVFKAKTGFTPSAWRTHSATATSTRRASS